MSVLLETSLGDLVIDLEVQQCPKTCENFLKLCKTFRYNYLTFFSVQKNFLAQTGDPTNSGTGGSSIWSRLPEASINHSRSPYFTPERHRTLKHTAKGTISMACTYLGNEDDDDVVAGSQFFITLANDIEYLDGKHAPFGRVVEGNEAGGTLDKINNAFVDKEMRPLRDIRIQHLVVLDDPFDDPQGLQVPSRTPSPTPEQLAAIGLDASAPNNDTDVQEKPAEETEAEKRKADTNAAALTLEMVGDLPFAEVRPPENILFVCKLNPITRSEDLQLIFSRFGTILSCEVIKDKKTGTSLQYAFIEFDKQESAEQAYFKMQNVLIDDRRIWVDFSQSVSKLSTNWNTSRAKGKPLRVTGGAGARITKSKGSAEYVHDYAPARSSSVSRRRSPMRNDLYGGHRNERRDRDERRGHGDDRNTQWSDDRHYRNSRDRHLEDDRRSEAVQKYGEVDGRDRRHYDDRYSSSKSYQRTPSRAERERSPPRSRHVH